MGTRYNCRASQTSSRLPRQHQVQLSCESDQQQTAPSAPGTIVVRVRPAGDCPVSTRYNCRASQTSESDQQQTAPSAPGTIVVRVRPAADCPVSTRYNCRASAGFIGVRRVSIGPSGVTL